MLACHNSKNQEIFMLNEIQCWEKVKMNEEAREWTPFPESPSLKEEKQTTTAATTETSVGSHCHGEAKKKKKKKKNITVK